MKKPWYRKYFWYGIFWSLFAALLGSCVVINILSKNYLALPICLFAFAMNTTNAIGHFNTYRKEKSFYEKKSTSKIE